MWFISGFLNKLLSPRNGTSDYAQRTTQHTFKAGTEQRTKTTREVVRPRFIPHPHPRMIHEAKGRGRVLTRGVAGGREPGESAHPARPSATCLPDFFCFLFAFFFLLAAAAAAAAAAGVEVGVGVLLPVVAVVVVVVVDAGNAASSAISATTCSCSWAAGLHALFVVPAARRSSRSPSAWLRLGLGFRAGLGLGLGLALGLGPATRVARSAPEAAGRAARPARPAVCERAAG